MRKKTPLDLFIKALETHDTSIAIGHAVDKDFEYFEITLNTGLAVMQKDGENYTFEFNKKKQTIDVGFFEHLAQKFRQKLC